MTSNDLQFEVDLENLTQLDNNTAQPRTWPFLRILTLGLINPKRHDFISNAQESTALQSFNSAELQLVRTLTSTREDRNPTNKYTEWYLNFLRAHFQQISVNVTNVVQAVPLQPKRPAQFDQMCGLIEAVAESISGQSDITFDGVVVNLKAKSLLTTNGEVHFFAHQLVFIITGLITMLYEPSLEPQTDRLVITNGTTEEHKAPRHVTWTKHYLKKTETTEIPVNVLLKHLSTMDGPIPHQASESSRVEHNARVEQDALQASNLCYYTLTAMANIKIRWVKNVCEHLEFNQREKVLKIFCFPSFCAMMCSGSSKSTFLDKLFDECLPELATETRSDYPRPAAYKFFREIIFTYRLIFGQSKDSWKAYRKAHGTKLNKEQLGAHWDPLRPMLCAYDWSNVPIYSELDAPDVRAVYSARSDFPFFAERLINLQQYIATQSPNDWKALWRDRRDVARFWALWAVVIFGGAAIFLGIIQVGLAAAQVASSFRSQPRF